MQPLNNISQEQEFLLSLNLFNGLDNDIFSSLLKSSSIKTYKNGSTIFSQGEEASYLYVILKGNAKIFRTTENGHESIPQILCQGQTFMETSIFLGANSPISAEAIGKVALLAIPAGIIRKTAKMDIDFAMNLLQVMSQQSASLIYQIEQITLKSATQRVGRFLVKTMLEADKRDLKFQLPFDKSIIASHLAMTPETLSRSLSSLKKQGILTEGKQISIPEMFSLCGYCDASIANKCEYYGTDKCIVEYCPNTY